MREAVAAVRRADDDALLVEEGEDLVLGHLDLVAPAHGARHTTGVLKLVRFPYSTNVDRVALALAHKGVEVESVWVAPATARRCAS